MSIPLLRTKLYIPWPGHGRVPRPRLVERLNEGLDRKLTLISAPAGFGKTTLLSQWIPIQKRTAHERVPWWETPKVQFGLPAFFYFLHT